MTDSIDRMLSYCPPLLSLSLSLSLVLSSINLSVYIIADSLLALSSSEVSFVVVLVIGSELRTFAFLSSTFLIG